MALAPSITINLPGWPFENFPSVETIAALRALPSSGFATGDNYVVDGGSVAGDGGGGVYAWNDASLDADDGSTVIRPGDTSPGQAGRWVLAGASTFGEPVNTLRDDIASTVSSKGAALVGVEGGGTVQDKVEEYDTTLKYVRSSPYEIKIGYDSVSDTTAAVKVGANNAFTGAGVLMIGGAGKKDGGNGTYIGGLGHPDWPALQPSIARNPLELAVYSNQTTGVGTSTGTTTFTSTSGTFTSADAGHAIWLNGSSYTINSYVDSTHVVLNAAPPAGTYVWHIVRTTGSGTCTVSGGTVSRVTGDPFIQHTFGTGFTFKLNGSAYTVTATAGADQCTISSPPANGTYSYSYETNINDQLAAVRVGPQFPSLDEENVTLMSRTMRYELRTLYAGSGAYRDLVIGSGEYSAGALAEQITCHSDGALTLQKLGSKTVRLGGAIAADRMFNISRNAGYFGGLRLETNSLARWDIGAGNGAESGANAGSNLFINRFDDAGAFLATALSISRSNGLVTLEKIAATLTSAANDAAAAAAGVAIGQFYRNGSAVQVRVV